MARRMKRVLGIGFIAMLLPVLSSCGSAPATRFYTLNPEPAKVAVSDETSHISFGIGPVQLPAYLNNTAIVSRNASQMLNISGYHAWAGPLDAAITRVLVSDIGHILGSDNVWGFPWDMRARPDIQVAITIEQFDGARDGEVILNLKWNAFKLSENLRIDHGYISHTVSSASKTYSDYVRALNEALHKAANDLAVVLAKYQS